MNFIRCQAERVFPPAPRSSRPRYARTDAPPCP